MPERSAKPRSRLIRLAISLLSAVSLASCGGGGSDSAAAASEGAPPGAAPTQLPDTSTLFISVRYEEQFTPFQLFQESTLLPTLTGFEGHQPRCSLQAGSLPPGVQLRTDCALTGRPTAAGDPYPFTVRVTVPGFQGAVDFPGGVFVHSPVATYAGHAGFGQTLPRGSAINDLPSISGWSPAAGEAVRWEYALATGSLPPGLRLASDTGAITGNATAAGSFTAEIRARLVTQFGSYDLPPSSYSVNVDVPTFDFFYFGSRTDAGNFRAFAGVALAGMGAITPDQASLGDFRLATGASLPQGLSLDPASGNIRGTPSQLSALREVAIEATVTKFGVSNTTTSILKLEVVEPVLFGYGTRLAGRVGTPVAQTAVVTNVDPFFNQPVTRKASPRPGACTLPPGLTMQPLNGQITGTPTTAGTFECTVDFDVEVNGATWRQAAQFLIAIE